MGRNMGLIDRRALGSLVFADRQRTSRSRAYRSSRDAVAVHRGDRERAAAGLAPAVVLDAAILLEAGWDDLCDRIVFVEASWPVRLARVSRSRGWSAEVLRAREAAQWSCESKKAMAHVVLDQR